MKSFSILLGSLCLLVSQAVAGELSKPNILVILADDLGYGDLSCYNPNSAVKTPHLDRMAKEGVRLTDFYAQVCCTPTRAALMTGCYPKRVGLDSGSWGETLSYGDPKGLNPDETTIAELFKKRGYATGCIGKWHLGDQHPFLPLQQGFDEFFGTHTSASGPDYPKIPPPERQKRPGRRQNVLQRNNEPIVAPFEEISKLPAMFAEEAASFISRHKDRPFFLYMPHTAMHGPANPGEAWRGKSRVDAYHDLLLELDDGVGKVFQALEANGLSGNTLVFLTSDNGGGGHTSASNFPLRHHKGSIWEGGSRVPTIAWWPGRIPAGTVSRGIANVTDLLPTLIRIVDGKPYQSPRTIDGLDVSGILFDPEHARSPRTLQIIWSYDEPCAIREGKWKYLNLRGGQLFDLEADISESQDLIKQYPDVAEALKKRMAEVTADLGGKGERGAGCRPAGFVQNPKFPVPTVDGLTEPDWNDPRWQDPGDIEAFRTYLLERKAEKLKARQKKAPEKPAKPKAKKPVK